MKCVKHYIDTYVEADTIRCKKIVCKEHQQIIQFTNRSYTVYWGRSSFYVIREKMA